MNKETHSGPSSGSPHAGRLSETTDGTCAAVRLGPTGGPPAAISARAFYDPSQDAVLYVMTEMFTDADLDHQNRLREAFDPGCRSNPGKVLPVGHSCADIQALRVVPPGVWG